MAQNPYQSPLTHGEPAGRTRLRKRLPVLPKPIRDLAWAVLLFLGLGIMLYGLAFVGLILASVIHVIPPLSLKETLLFLALGLAMSLAGAYLMVRSLKRFGWRSPKP